MKQTKQKFWEKTGLHNFFLQNWYTPKLQKVLYFLVPFSLLFSAIIFLRKKLYKIFCSSNKKLDKKSDKKNKSKVIIIGNITIGGTGKTPLIIALGKYLQKKGLKIGVISRGYGSVHSKLYPKEPYEIKSIDTSDYVGDEPLLISKELNNIDKDEKFDIKPKRLETPVIICAKRKLALEYLEDKFSNKIDIVLSDDGLQHYALRRDLEIVVVDGSVGFGNNWVMPAGPLREPLSRLEEVDFVLINSNKNHQNNKLKKDLADIKTFNMQIISSDIYPINSDKNNTQNKTINKNIEKLANNFKDKKICALCAIGNPERFFKTLSSLGFKDFVKIALPDHKALSESELLKISADFDYIFMTQKDAIKYQDMTGVLESGKFWVVGVDAVCEDGFFNALSQKLK